MASAGRWSEEATKTYQKKTEKKRTKKENSTKPTHSTQNRDAPNFCERTIRKIQYLETFGDARPTDDTRETIAENPEKCDLGTTGSTVGMYPLIQH